MYKRYLGILLVSLYGCNDSKTEGNDLNIIDSDLVSGPCVFLQREPVINIKRVSDVITNSGIETIEIGNIHFNEEPIEFDEIHSELTSNIVIDYENNSLICTLPCGFLNREGQYEFTVKTVGYQQKTVQTNATYSVFEGGCPSYSDVGTELFIELTKSS